jgi:hypothetical protein
MLKILFVSRVFDINSCVLILAASGSCVCLVHQLHVCRGVALGHPLGACMQHLG